MDLLLALAHDAGRIVCHQLPERSFFIDGRQLPVCARCTGLYLSGVVGMLVWVAWRLARGRGFAAPPRAALLVVAVAAVPTLISYVTGVAGVWDGSNATRAMLAAPLGLAAGAVAAAVATKDLR